MRTSAFVLAIALAISSLPACGPVSVKQQIDRDDRVAFESLRTFQKAETGLFKAGAPWPTAEQHKAINAKLSQAYLLVIDVANVGLALKAGDPLPAQAVAELGQLSALVADVTALASSKAGAPPNATTQAQKAQGDVAKLAAAVSGGK